MNKAETRIEKITRFIIEDQDASAYASLKARQLVRRMIDGSARDRAHPTIMIFYYQNLARQLSRSALSQLIKLVNSEKV